MNTTNSIHIPARQCGKTLVQEMERSLFEAARMDKTASIMHVGDDVHRALKSLPLALDFKAPEGSPDKMLGIPVKLNALLPPDGWAFLDRKGNVIAMGTLKKRGE